MMLFVLQCMFFDSFICRIDLKLDVITYYVLYTFVYCSIKSLDIHTGSACCSEHAKQCRVFRCPCHSKSTELRMDVALQANSLRITPWYFRNVSGTKEES